VSLPYYRQVGVTQTTGTINLVEVETRNQEKAAGATETKNVEANAKGKIVEFALKMKRDGYQQSTIQRYFQGLLYLTKIGANVFDPESVKEIIAKQPWKEDTKLNYVNFYDTFTKFLGIHWARPIYQTSQKFPFIPLEQEVDQLIAGTPRKISVVLQIIKETAMRIGEVLRLKWTDINSENNTIIINYPEKGGKAGIYKVTPELITRILSLPRKSERIFPTSRVGISANFQSARKRLVQKLNNPRLLRITFHTIRHWKATMEYHKTKDIIHVKENILRHQSIENTMLYIHLEKVIFGSSSNDEYHVKTAKTIDEACELAKVGFDYFTTIEGVQIFRKRK